MQEMMQTDVGCWRVVVMTHVVARGSERVDGVAVAALAARPTGEVPGIGGAAVAVLTDHVGLAGTLAAVLITLTLVGG